MDFYIQVLNGEPVGNPMDELSAKYYSYNTLGAPIGTMSPALEPFLPTREPDYELLEVLETSDGFKKIDGKWQTEYTVRPMTAEEKEAHAEKAKEEWVTIGPGYASWVYNEETGMMNPPVQPPSDFIALEWDEENQEWIGEPFVHEPRELEVQE